MSLPRWIPILLFVAALIGFADASFLTAQHVRGVLPPCVTDGCDQVLTSKYASLGGFPVAALGMLYYGSVLVLLIAFFDTGNRRFLHGVCWLVSAGMLATLYFLAVQMFILHAFCQYCLLSAAVTILMFIASVRIMRAD